MATDHHHRRTSLAGMQSRFTKGLDLIGRMGAFHMADDSFPEEQSPRRKSWRFFGAPRISLLLSGGHHIAYVLRSKTIEAHLRPGDVWFYPPDTHDDEIFAAPCEYLGVVFQENYTRFVVVKHSGRKGTYPAPTWFHWDEARPPAVRSTLAAMNHIFRHDEAHSAGSHLCRALWLLAILWLQSGRKEPPPRSKAAATWMTVDRFLQENYHQPLNRKVVANSLHIHPSRISELCRQFGGKGFQVLLEERRLRQAKRFLVNSHTKIEAIAVMCGYSGGAYFTRAFARAEGMPPGEWRLKHAKG